ncbi:MAG TPA: DUF523 domain-containing protein [Clostridia bacterium]|nr:DUF523 domain-containing protein [Clostridia bacterium]
MILVSACLAGVNCKYNGGNSRNDFIVKMVQEGNAIPVCPEQLGGCSTPRLQVEIFEGTGADVLEGKCRVVRKNGEDTTKEFIKGANEVLNIAKLANADSAILKARSPSCGSGQIYDGTFSGKLREGNGVTAELLIRNQIKVISEEDI